MNKKVMIPGVDLDLALIYSGCKKPFQNELVKKMDQLHEELQSSVMPKNYWRLFDLEFLDNKVALKGTSIVLEGELAAKRLQECKQVVFMAGTLSIGFDQKLASKSLVNASDALLFDSLGSSAIESVMDQIEQEIQQDLPDIRLLPRFSCGYGDLPLKLQKDLFREFDLSRKCGIYLSDSLMMNPTKSITAFAGVKNQMIMDCCSMETKISKQKNHNCDECTMKSKCEYSKTISY